MYEHGLTTPEVEEQIALLIEKDMLNEERFARAIARGKFHMKQWGKRKIIEQLKQQQISDYCIKKAMTEIDPDEYYETLKRLAEKKSGALSIEKKEYIKKQKIYLYLLQKGYESNLILEVLNELLNVQK